MRDIMFYEKGKPVFRAVVGHGVQCVRVWPRGTAHAVPVCQKSAQPKQNQSFKLTFVFLTCKLLYSVKFCNKMPAGTADVKYWNEDSSKYNCPSNIYLFCFPRNYTRDLPDNTVNTSGQSHRVILRPRSDFQSH